jgi:hypothetical protein
MDVSHVREILNANSSHQSSILQLANHSRLSHAKNLQKDESRFESTDFIDYMIPLSVVNGQSNAVVSEEVTEPLNRDEQ